MIQPRKTVQTLQAYMPPLEGRRGFMRLDFNENTTGFPELYGEQPPSLMTAYPEYQTFMETLSKQWSIDPKRLLVTNGSDEGLFTIAFTFIEPNVDKAIVSSPTYALIPHYIRLVQSQLIEVPVTHDYQYNIDGIEAALKQGAKLAMFASPDNPTGAMICNDVIRRWCQNYPETLFVIDEAYAEYAPESALPLTEEFQNLLVTRTFSKAWGLAGLRLGLVIGQPPLIESMQRVRSPYSVNTLAVSTACQLLSHHKEVLQQACDTMQRKNWTISVVEKYGYRIVPGQANFFMMYVGIQAKTFCDFFRQEGILVRDRSSMPQLAGMVRISIGSQKEMDHFLATLVQYHARQTLLFDMDDTLVDTSESFDAVIKTLVEKYSGQPLMEKELQALRAEGGFNDDWDATVELLRRRNIQKPRTEVVEEGVVLYLKLAPQKETWIASPEKIQKLKQRYRLGVVTGRCRIEYESVWQDRFAPLFELVVCQDDYPDAGKKPKPDLLLKALEHLGLEQGFYIGNSVDDMQAARAAGLGAIAVTTTQSAEVLNNAGAEWILNDFSELEKVLG